MDTSDCIPLLSEYTDCSEANICTGCRRCSCTIEGRWSCQIVHDCPDSEEDDLYDVDTISNAYEILFNELEDKLDSKSVHSIKPTTEGSRVLEMEDDFRLEEEIKRLMTRVKRSTDERIKSKNTSNGTVKFYHTVDELNEDTLRNTNVSGTIEAKKIEGVKVPKISRRTSLMDSKNITGIDDLHIEINQPKDYDHQIVDNKIDSPLQISHKLHYFNGDEIKMLNNFSQSAKDKDVSKLVVNELRKGSEKIGDKHSTPVSNITFTPENDTLTAMAFIAGNLLSKLWKIEEDSGIGSSESEVLKHEKIADLLDLFKEPLTIRQETFIKNALERLSQVVSKESVNKNISLCETLATSENLFKNMSNLHDKDQNNFEIKCKSKKEDDKKQGNATVEAITKINSVLTLIKKYEDIQNRMMTFKGKPTSFDVDRLKEKGHLTLSEHEDKSLNTFGNLIKTIINLILPKKSKSSKKIITKLLHSKIYNDSPNINKKIEEIIGVDSNNLEITVKDRLIMDYLDLIESNPSCFSQGEPIKLTNLFTDYENNLINNLVKLLNINTLKDITESSLLQQVVETTKGKEINVTDKNRTQSRLPTNANNSLTNATEKLKKHLTEILEDLSEIQKQNSSTNDTYQSLSTILPCIRKMFKVFKDEESTNKPKESKYQKIAIMFDSLKSNFKFSPLTRRNEWYLSDTAASSNVWDRIIKNLNGKSKLISRRSHSNLRRHNEDASDLFTKLKQLIENVDVSSGTYKQYVQLASVPMSSHLILLKVLQASVQQIAIVLDKIKAFTETVKNPSMEEHFEVQKFVNDAARTINLNDKILQTLKLKTPNYSVKRSEDFGSKKKTINENIVEAVKNDVNANVFKLTREQIIVQLIRNRVQLYLRLKEGKGLNLSEDINYNVARKIMSLLASGNISLAKELFSMFIGNSKKETSSKNSSYYLEASSTPRSSLKTPRNIFSKLASNPENLAPGSELQMQDNIVKQLLRLKMNV